MNRAGITAFATAMADTLNALYGSTVTYAGTDYQAVVSTGEPELNLEAGGFQSPVEFVVRIRKSDLPESCPFASWQQGPPSTKSDITINCQTFYIMAVREHFSPLAQEWILEVGTP